MRRGSGGIYWRWWTAWLRQRNGERTGRPFAQAAMLRLDEREDIDDEEEWDE